MTFKYKPCIFSILLLFLFVSCTSVKKPKTLPEKVPPNFCRINGTIIDVEMIDETSGPCAEHPCLATVIINNVIGTGSNFRVPLIKNDTIKIKFEFTLSETTKELFPTLNYFLPGLSYSDIFIADVEKIDLIQLGKTNSKKFQYKIYNYDKID